MKPVFLEREHPLKPSRPLSCLPPFLSMSSGFENMIILYERFVVFTVIYCLFIYLLRHKGQIRDIVLEKT